MRPLRPRAPSVLDSSSLRCTIELPADFRCEDFLAFHCRDRLQIAEVVSSERLIKGIIWAGHPARLILRLSPLRAEAVLELDGSPGSFAADDLERRVRRMLGLMQPIEAFEHRFVSHPQFGALIRGRRGLRVPMAASPFEALSWAIIGQQISLNAAISIRRRFIQATAVQHSSGLWCYPDAFSVARLSEAQLRAVGLSASKVRTLQGVIAALQENRLELLPDTDLHAVESLRTRLLGIKGIGPWTVNYTLLRGFGWLDASLHGDVAVRRSLQALLKTEDKLSEAQTQRWLEAFSPWRALVAAHLWSWHAATPALHAD